jgi:hypothetical protein
MGNVSAVRCAEVRGEKLCRTYGAWRFLLQDPRPSGPGLTCGAPPALGSWTPSKSSRTGRCARRLRRGEPGEPAPAAAGRPGRQTAAALRSSGQASRRTPQELQWSRFALGRALTGLAVPLGPKSLTAKVAVSYINPVQRATVTKYAISDDRMPRGKEPARRRRYLLGRRQTKFAASFVSPEPL